nr:retrotransposon Orf1 [Tanacetum cinerariifolium]
ESDSKDENVFEPNEVKKIVKPSLEKIEFVNARNATVKNESKAKKPRKFSQSPRGNKRNWNGLMNQKLGDGFEFKKKACFVCGSINHLIKDYDFYENKMVLNDKGKITGPKEKPTESKEFEQIINFLNVSYVKYALMVNHTVYTSCIEQFWATAKHLDGRVKFLMYPRFVQLFLDNQVEGMDRHNAIFVISSHKEGVCKHKEGRKGFLWEAAVLTKSRQVPVNAAKQSSCRAAASISAAKRVNTAASRPNVNNALPTTYSYFKTYSPKPTESKEFEQIIDFLNVSYVKYALMVNHTVYTSCIEQFWATAKVLDLEEAKTNQAKEIASLKKRVKKLEQKKKSRTSGLKRLRKVRTACRIESSTEASLGDQEDASKQGRMIDNINQDVEITFVDE